jgi:3'(2'), 5'-bisphosphate nucleotidase
MNRETQDLKAHQKYLLGSALRASLLAGDAVMKVYDTDFEVFLKIDRTPLTEADRQSHKMLADQLGKDIPLLSEEGSQTAFEDRKNWNLFWLVDPLDGTKEFVKRTGEFTVNVALMENGGPIAGVVYLPAKGDLYFGGRGIGACRLQSIAIEKIKASKPEDALESAMEFAVRLPHLYSTRAPDKIKVVQSASHSTDAEVEFISRLKRKIDGIETTPAGSSLKFCRVAEGSADLYVRFGPTMEWDTAAGHCVAESAGCEILDLAADAPLLYNKHVLRNSAFMVIGSRLKTEIPWRDAAMSCARACVDFPA